MYKKVICIFCGKEMKQGGGQYFGSHTDTLTYWCDCGSVANFSKGCHKKIKSVNLKYEFEE
jgi:ribosomal protein L24E